MRKKKIYCLYCGIVDDFSSPCSCSEIGSHRPVTEGDVRYRVKGPDGYICLFHSVPEGYELIEKIVY